MRVTLRAFGFGTMAMAIMGLLFPPEVLADNGQRVVFPRGKDSVTLSGKLPRKYADYYYYLVRARKGQTLTVSLDSADPGAHLAIYETKKLGPDEDTILAPTDHPREWSGELPITSDYSIQVYGVREVDDKSAKGLPYTITITIR